MGPPGGGRGRDGPATLPARAAAALAGAALWIAAAAAAPAAQEVRVRDLGTLGGGWSRAEGVNARGWVVGASQVAPGRLHAVSGHAFLWRDGRMRDLGTLGGTESAARDVNDRGQVVGVAQYDSVGRGRRFVELSRRAFLWEDGRMRGLGTLGGRGSEANAINDRGQVVGRSQVDPGRLHSTSYHAFLWEDGRMRDLGTLGGTESVAFDVNASGDVVGASQTAPGRDRRVRVHAFLWRDGRMRDLGTLGGASSRALAINDRGQVVGVSETSDGRSRAFLWEDGRMRSLGTLGGGSSRANDIDDRGRVVGASATRDGEVHAFLWEDGRMRDLGALAGDSRALAVDEEGPVVGASRTKRSRSGQVSVHAVAWDVTRGPSRTNLSDVPPSDLQRPPHPRPAGRLVHLRREPTMPQSSEGRRVVIRNRKARHEYEILEQYEAGIVLEGAEVKSLRQGDASFTDAFARVDDGEAWLYNLHISPYEQASTGELDPTRPRKLLLHKHQIEQIAAETERKGRTVVPLDVHFSHGVAKVQIAVAKGKKLHDKREDLKRRAQERDAERAVDQAREEYR